MGIELRPGNVVFLDTAPLIYFWEKHDKYFGLMMRFFDSVYALNIQCIVSLITYIEVITYPSRIGDVRTAGKYRNYLVNSRNFQMAPLTLAVADRTPFYRNQYGLKTPDAIQLATADVLGADYVITNDREWRKVASPQVVLVGDLRGRS